MASFARLPAAPDGPGPLLVGRAREQAVLRRAIDRALARQGGLVLIGGEAGIGKTALMADTLQKAAGLGALGLTGHCYDLTDTPPYGPWLDLFSRYLPTGDLPPLPAALTRDTPDGVTSQEALFGQVRDCLLALARRGPVVLALDDLHWSDQTSLDLLRFLARQLATAPILAVVTYRDEEVTPRNRLFPLLPLLVSEAQPVRIDLGHLSPEAVRDLIRSRYELSQPDEDRLVGHLRERGEGNPFYIGELLRSFEEEGLLRPESNGNGWILGDIAQSRLPRLLGQVIHARLARLGEEARKHLAVAAVIGQEVPLAIWATVAGTDEEALLDLVERAVEARVLAEVSDGARVRFVHALLRETLYGGLLAARRRVWHRRVAEALLVEATPDPVTIAYHFRQAGDAREAEWLVRAGERARALYVPRVAIEHFTRALDLARQQSRPPTPAVHRARGLAYETLGEFELARADLDTALALSRASGDRRAEWQALLDVGLLWEGHDYTRAGVYYQQSLDLARAIGDPVVLANSLNRIGNWECNVELPRDAREHQREALALLRESGDQRGITTTLDLLATAIWGSGQPAAAIPVWREAASLCRELDDRLTLVSCLTYLMVCGGTYATEAGPHSLPLDEAQAYGEEAVRLAREIDSRTGETWARLMLAWCLGEQGTYGRALDLAKQSLDVAEEIEHHEWIGAAHFTLGALQLDLLAAARAQAHLERALALAQGVGSPWWIKTATWTLARACLLQGDLSRAEALLAAVFDSESSPTSLVQCCCWYARAELVLAQGEPALALEILDRVIDATAGASVGRFSPFVGKLRAEALAALGRPGQAEATLRAALSAATPLGARRLLWRLHAALAALYRRQGRPGEAEQAASAARALVEELAANVPDGELRVGFRRGALALIGTGKPQSVYRATYPAGLSAREVEVLRQLAAGLSNAEIAARLVLSTRTVNAHLTNM